MLDENNITSHRRLVVATQESLRYCSHNVPVLDIGRYFGYLIGLTKQLTGWRRRLECRTEAAGKNLKTAIEAKDEARASTELAKNVWGLTLLAFVFIPLNFMTSAFAVHLWLLGFHEDDGRLRTWLFFAVAVSIELLVLFFFRAISENLVKTWRRCGLVVRGTWRKLRRGRGTTI